MYTLETKHEKILDFLDKVDISRYGKSRNYLDGQVSHLSAYITHGALCQVRVLEFLKTKFKPYQIKAFAFQMAWREYFHNVWSELGDDIFSDIKNTQQDVKSYNLSECMVKARTGLLAIDEQLKLLTETGYMHNHARMWTAGFVCNFANFYWLENSKWMYYHLLDGDLASNMLSWQWVSGCFSSKKYLFNQDNLNKYSKVQQSGTFIDKPYANLLSDSTPDFVFEESNVELSTDYPDSEDIDIDSLGSQALLYHPWMLDPDWMPNSSASRILLIEPRVFDRFPISPMRMKFILELAKNINGLKILVMNFDDLKSKCKSTEFISQSHPLISDWDCDKLPKGKMFPSITGYDSSFFKFWKKAEKSLNIS
jgi:deoxyribodipyrimidine photo-lyase